MVSLQELYTLLSTSYAFPSAFELRNDHFPLFKFRAYLSLIIIEKRISQISQKNDGNARFASA